jgi:hypothetical protein
VPVPLAEVWMPVPVELFGKVVVLVAGKAMPALGGVLSGYGPPVPPSAVAMAVAQARI